MQVGIKVTYMYTNFCGHGSSGFRDIATLKNGPNFPFRPWAIVHGHQKIESIGIGSKIHASMDLCHMHVHQFW